MSLWMMKQKRMSIVKMRRVIRSGVRFKISVGHIIG